MDSGQSDRGRRGSGYRDRVYPSRRMRWRSYVEAVATELENEGAREAAKWLRGCGRTIRTVTCASGHTNRLHPIGCGNRACALCARKDSQEQATAIENAAQAMPAHAAQAAREFLATVDTELARETRLVSFWAERVRGHREHDRDVAAARDLAHVREHVAMVRRLRRWKQQARRASDANQWRWREITLAEVWNPSDPAEWTISAMRERVKRLFATWRALYAEINVGGAAQYVCAVEMSNQGHVHAHVLYFGPWLPAREGHSSLLTRWARAFNPRAGMVAVGAAHGTTADAIREAVKYALKAGSPGDPLWLAGIPRPVPHPVAAARWHLALHGIRRVTYSRALRFAMDQFRPEHAPLRCTWVHQVGPFKGQRCECELPAIVLGEWDSEYTDDFARRVLARASRDGPRNLRRAANATWRAEVRTQVTIQT